MRTLVSTDAVLRPSSATGPAGWTHIVEGPAGRVAIVVLASSLADRLGQALPDAGGASATAIAVVDADGRALVPGGEPAPVVSRADGVEIPGSPGWRAVAVPRRGSLEAQASREVRRYALWLVVVVSVVLVALVLAAIGGMGLGALNELVEVVATLLIPETNVGGYMNTGWDLVANFVGATSAVVIIFVRARREDR